ncbi:hypothetical protein R4P64_32590 [Rhodococcus sp. IEGM 1366]|uniref:hypothetical protein n=1 Tax=Rhodococcus sp. IEGM 1366 TaxID=3082223 RepID=UPI002953E99C|nr:hypothetical protein [Rhodococcus sp. IEGM 1366]MDV8071256.1 hypothetical protein [Rhodococcus sp. IEGM 1366]
MDLRDWAGDVWTELDAAQQALLVRAAESIEERYPDPDVQLERDAALSSAVQYMLGETTAAYGAITSRLEVKDAYRVVVVRVNVDW